MKRQNLNPPYFPVELLEFFREELLDILWAQPPHHLLVGALIVGTTLYVGGTLGLWLMPLLRWLAPVVALAILCIAAAKAGYLAMRRWR